MLRIRTALTLAALPLLACETNVRVENLPGVVDTVGPAYFDGEELRITFSTYDPEGDAVDIDATFSTGGDFQPIPLPEGTLDDVVSERARSTEHVVVWAIEGVVASTDSVTVRFGAPGQAAVTFGPFVPDELDDEPARRPVEDVGTDASVEDTGDTSADVDASDDAADVAEDATDTQNDVAADVPGDTADGVSDTAADGSDADAVDADVTDTSEDTDVDAADATDTTDTADASDADVSDVTTDAADADAPDAPDI